MATLTKADIAGRVLEHLGVKPSRQAASAADTAVAEEAVQSAWARLRYELKAPFDVDEVPEWAWIPLRNFAARDLVDAFGITGERLQSILSSAMRADRDFAIQSAGHHDPRIATAPRWF